MADSFKFWIAYLLIVGGVLFTGWREPLRYRFMSQTEVYEETHPPTPTPGPPRSAWMWNAEKRTSLERPVRGPNNYSRPLSQGAYHPN